MPKVVVEEADIPSVVPQQHMQVLVECRADLPLNSGIEVYRIDALAPMSSQQTPARVTETWTYVVPVDDPEDSDAQERVKKAFHQRLLALRPNRSGTR